MDKDSTRLKLLLVDDQDDLRRATSAVLGRRGFTVTDGGELVGILRGRDIIIEIAKRMRSTR